MQWLTAGRGIVHSEMFPLLDRTAPNPVELFQIWLNLPAADKMTDPYFAMMWDGTSPGLVAVDDAGRTVDHRHRRRLGGPSRRPRPQLVGRAPGRRRRDLAHPHGAGRDVVTCRRRRTRHDADALLSSKAIRSRIDGTEIGADTGVLLASEPAASR